MFSSDLLDAETDQEKGVILVLWAADEERKTNLEHCFLQDSGLLRDILLKHLLRPDCKQMPLHLSLLLAANERNQIMHKPHDQAMPERDGAEAGAG